MELNTIIELNLKDSKKIYKFIQLKFTQQSQFTMILDIVENLILYVEPVVKVHQERVEQMKFAFRLTSFDDAHRHKGEVASRQNKIRNRLMNMKAVQKEHYQLTRVSH